MRHELAFRRNLPAYHYSDCNNNFAHTRAGLRRLLNTYRVQAEIVTEGEPLYISTLPPVVAMNYCPLLVYLDQHASYWIPLLPLISTYTGGEGALGRPGEVILHGLATIEEPYHGGRPKQHHGHNCSSLFGTGCSATRSLGALL